MTTDAEGTPYLRVVRGNPTAAELAAVVAVVAARRAAVAPAQATPSDERSKWTSKARLARYPLHAGPGAWRASAMHW
jgi:hypothetical protein